MYGYGYAPCGSYNTGGEWIWIIIVIFIIFFIFWGGGNYQNRPC